MIQRRALPNFYSSKSRRRRNNNMNHLVSCLFIQQPLRPSFSIVKSRVLLPVATTRRHASSQVVVTSRMVADESPFLAKVVVNDKHLLQADEPTSFGGHDVGPSPYDLLLSALGSCTVMTLRMYADRKQLPLTGVSVVLSHNKVHKKDCEECGDDKSKSPMFDRIERIISVEGEGLTEKERTRLLEIANKCPVHRTLEQGQVVVVSSLTD
jgi:putative redox protein